MVFNGGYTRIPDYSGPLLGPMGLTIDRQGCPALLRRGIPISTRFRSSTTRPWLGLGGGGISFAQKHRFLEKPKVNANADTVPSTNILLLI